ncbi:cysteine-rich KTR domain-containing protein [Enterocloster clostridioformis]|uniref:cysteine-rich KTR domain-containing protein n=1 Tax=Enterocloster clostridioformis TaxID=1531 RepID=UPI003AB6E17C
MKGKSEWLLCPICKKKTRVKIYDNTELKNFPLFCPKCKKETLIDYKQKRITIIDWPDAKTQS